MAHRVVAGGGPLPAMSRPDSGPGQLRLIAVLLAIGAASLVGPGADAVAAQDVAVTSAEAARLARAAVDSDGARAELMAVERVDGRPVDLGSAIAEDGPAQVERLQVLAEELDRASMGADAEVVDSTDSARSRAETVLDDDKFQQSDVPKPFKGLLEWLADRLRPVGEVLSSLFAPILALPGGPFILGSMFFVAAGLATGWLVGRRSRAVLSGRGGRDSLVDRDADPDDLDRRATDAEDSGAHGEAIRLRYQAGLLRLARAGQLTLRADTTAAEAARQVDRAAMWALTGDFEQIVYGERIATAADVAETRHLWSALLAARVER